MVYLGLFSLRVASWQLEPAVIGTSPDPGLRLTQEVATNQTCHGGRSDGPCVDPGGIAELSCAPGLSRPTRSAGD